MIFLPHRLLRHPTLKKNSKRFSFGNFILLTFNCATYTSRVRFPCAYKGARMKIDRDLYIDGNFYKTGSFFYVTVLTHQLN